MTEKNPHIEEVEKILDEFSATGYFPVISRRVYLAETDTAVQLDINVDSKNPENIDGFLTIIKDEGKFNLYIGHTEMGPLMSFFEDCINEFKAWKRRGKQREDIK